MNTAAGTARGGRRHHADLERDSEAIRADMDRTLEVLENRFSPREVVDRSLSYLQEHGSEITHRALRTVKENPVPIAVTAAGLMWLATSMMARSHSDARAAGLEERDDDELSEEELELREQQWDEEEERPRFEDADDPQIVRHKLARTGRFVRQKTGQARTALSELIEHQPLVLGMLAVAAGALLGSALPETEYERRALSSRPRKVGGTTRDSQPSSGAASGSESSETTR